MSNDKNIALKKKELMLLREVRKRQCERSLHQFVLDAHYYLFNERLDDNWHLKYICDRIQTEIERIAQRKKKNKDIIINIPPRSLKSFSITVASAAWAWIHKPSMKFIGTSYSGDLSLQHNMWTKDIVKTQWYQGHWGNITTISKRRDTKEYFETQHKGLRACASTGSAITGFGGDIIIIDDPLNPKKAISDAERESANRYFDETLTTRLNNPEIGIFIIIMQRLHVDDLTGHLLKKSPDKYEHICIPAEKTADIKPLELEALYEDGLFFPKRFTKNYLDDLKIKMGSYAYAGQLLQTPKLEGSGMIQGKWFKRFKMNQLPDNVVWNFCVDSAYTKKTVNDPSGILCFCIHKNNMYIRGFSKVHMEFPELLKHLQKYTKAMDYSFRSRIYIEPKASGLSIVQQLKRKTKLNVISDKPPDTDKVTRAADASPTLEAGRVYLLEDAHWLDDFIYELEVFPLGEHDEAVDLICMAVRRFQKKTKVIRYSFGRKNQLWQ